MSRPQAWTGSGHHAWYTTSRASAAGSASPSCAPIHQPSAPLFELFTHLVLLCAGGELAYAGPTGDASALVIAYLSGIPVIAPMKVASNPAHWMLDEVGGGTNPDPDKQRAVVKAFRTSAQFQDLAQELHRYTQPAGTDVTFPTRFAASFGRQLRALFIRACKVYWRSPEYTLVRSAILLVFAAIFGTTFWRMGYEPSDFYQRMSFCYTTTFYCGLTYLVSAMSVLMGQRVVFYREKCGGMYSPAVYGLAYMLAEVPYFLLNGIAFVFILWPLSNLTSTVLGILGHLLPFMLFVCMCTFLGHALAAVSPNNEVAFAIGPGIACWFSSLAGFYLPPRSIPIAYLWVYWLNPFQYTFDSLMINNVLDARVPCPGDAPPAAAANATVATCPWADGLDALAYWGLRTTWLWYWMDQLVVLAYIAAWVLAALLALRFLQFDTR